MAHLHLPRLWQATLVTLATSLLFWLLFALSKASTLQAVNPLADDPYDAIASFAFQIAVFASLVTLLRTIAVAHDTRLFPLRARGIRNGNLLATGVTGISLITDAVALIQSPLHPDQHPWQWAVLAGLGGLSLLVLLSVWFQAHVYRPLTAAIEPQPLNAKTTLGATIDDVETSLGLLLPASARTTVGSMMRALFRPLRWFDPHRSPWRFASLVAVLLGTGLMLSHFIEDGPAPDFASTILVGAIFFTGETVVMFLAFVLLGGILMLRPPLLAHRS